MAAIKQATALSKDAPQVFVRLHKMMMNMRMKRVERFLDGKCDIGLYQWFSSDLGNVLTLEEIEQLDSADFRRSLEIFLTKVQGTLVHTESGYHIRLNHSKSIFDRSLERGIEVSLGVFLGVVSYIIPALLAIVCLWLLFV